MKLLFLGYLIIILLLINIFYNSYNKEGFGLDYNYSFVTDEINYYDTLKKTPVKSFSINNEINKWYTYAGDKLTSYIPKYFLDRGGDDEQILTCRTLSKCSEIPNTQCGYCGETDKFVYGNKNGPITDYCDKNKWAFTKESCDIMQAKKICNQVKKCGDLIVGTDAGDTCGWCPTKNKAVPKKNMGNIIVPRFNEDEYGCMDLDEITGENLGLISAGKCVEFNDDHPCVGPNENTGPHSEKCIMHLWQKTPGIQCKTNKPMGITTEKINKIYPGKNYAYIFNKMKPIRTNIKSNDYETAKTNSILCLGNADTLDPCDTKYNKNGQPIVECYMKKFNQSNCSKKGEEWKSLLNGKIPKMSAEKYENYLEDLYLKTTNAVDYSTRKRTSALCLGPPVPAPPPPMKIGDEIQINNIGIDFQNSRTIKSKNGNINIPLKVSYTGIVTKIVDENFIEVLWTSIVNKGNVLVNRMDYKHDTSNDSMNVQINYFGWPNKPPLKVKQLEKVNKEYITIIDRCGTASTCKNTCEDNLELVMYFPEPVDCVVSKWGSWSECTEKCGDSGKMTKKRTVLYPARRGGEKCGDLSVNRPCNRFDCSNPNFFNDNNEFVEKNTKYSMINKDNTQYETFKKKFSLISSKPIMFESLENVLSICNETSGCEGIIEGDPQNYFLLRKGGEISCSDTNGVNCGDNMLSNTIYYKIV
tara:strand:- start:1519 stop:3612 length:2094 start_codon:yes stop_codon:yes gene_type:complete